MDYATIRNKVKGEIPYIQYDGKKYRYVNYNTDTDTHYYRYKPLKQPDKKALAKLPTLEEARGLYNIELEETAPTPAQYFMRKVDEPSNYNILRTLTDRILVSYLKQHKDECPEVIYKLKELVKTHCVKEVREAALETLIAVGERDINSLTHYITDYTPSGSECITDVENKMTQYFLDKISNESKCLLLTLQGASIKQYLATYKSFCPELVDRVKEILKTNRKQKIRKAAYSVLKCANVEGYNELQSYTHKNPYKKERKDSPSPRKYISKIYNAPVGEFGFCCEEEKMAILFSSIKEKNWDNYDTFKSTFTTRYRADASIQTEESIRALYDKYYQYAVDGRFKKIQMMRGRRINSTLPEKLLKILERFDLKATRADGRGTSKVVKKCRKKKQYNKDRLSGFRIITKKDGRILAGKKYELYEEDVKEFCEKLLNGEITSDHLLVGEDE